MKFRMGGYLSIMVAIAVALVSCVDDTFRIDEVSKEVTLGNENSVTLPLGSLKDKSIEDLLGDAEIPGLEIDDSGNFLYRYDGEGSTLNIEGVSTEFEIPEIESLFDVEYPEFDFEMTPILIEESADIEVSGLEEFQDIIYGSMYYIPEGVELPQIHGEYYEEFEGDNLHIEFDVPHQIGNIDKVHFRDIENGHHGAPMHLRVQFNGLAGINGGGYLSFNLGIEGGTFIILDAENNVVYDGDLYTETYPIAAGADSIDFVVYIESITNSTPLDENHHFDMPLKLTYDMAFCIDATSGYFSMDKPTHIELFADFEYGDADVAVDSSVNLVECKVEGDNHIKIAGLPEQLKSVNRVAIVQDDSAILDFYAHGMEWLGDLAEDVMVEVALPDYLKLHHVVGETYDYDETTGVLTASIAELDKGVKVDIEALDFGAEGVTPSDNGEIELPFEPTIVARFREGSHVKVSQLEHDGNFTVAVGISSSHLSIDSVSACVDYAYEVEDTFVLEGLDDIDLEIAGVGIKPIIEVNISHPMTMQAMLSGVITPSVDDEVKSERAVAFDDIIIEAAEYNDGVITPAEVTIVIADESLREHYSDAKYTFVACDVTKLLVGSLPDAININLELGVDSTQMQTLYVTDSLGVSYDYMVEIPIAIDNSLEIRYSDEIADLSSIFEEVSEYDIKVGDVTLIATIMNTTPLEFGANVILKDADGNETEAQVRIPEGERIMGSLDGVTPKESILHLELELGEGGQLTKLSEVDIIAFELVAASAANDGAVALNKKQSVGATLQLQIDGGVTVDIDQFINKE